MKNTPTYVPDQYKISYNNFYRLYKKFESGNISYKQLGLLEKVTDMDYLHKIVNMPEERAFAAKFIGEHFAIDSSLRTKQSEEARRTKSRDLFSQFKQIDVSTSQNGEPTEDIVQSAMNTVNKVLDKNAYVTDVVDKAYQSYGRYTIRDYMPAPRFNPDGIITMIDKQLLSIRRKKFRALQRRNK